MPQMNSGLSALVWFSFAAGVPFGTYSFCSAIISKTRCFAAFSHASRACFLDNAAGKPNDTKGVAWFSSAAGVPFGTSLPSVGIASIACDNYITTMTSFSACMSAAGT